MKIAISGKGGAGKTTLSALIAAALATRGHRVVAIDADPDANLAAALGLSPNNHPVFLAEMGDLIAERTGAKNAYGGYFKLNPRVDDIPDRFARRIGSIRLLALGGVPRGGAGCICPASALIKALLTHLLLGSDDAVIMDMEAGIEHLGRATTQSMDALVTVVDQGPWSVQTALRVRDLAGDIGLTKVVAVVNRATATTDVEAIANRLGGIPVAGVLPYDPRLPEAIVAGADRQELRPTDVLNELLPEIEHILQRLVALSAEAGSERLAAPTRGQ
jgi:CO dehydrogenase maturation factor